MHLGLPCRLSSRSDGSAPKLGAADAPMALAHPYNPRAALVKPMSETVWSIFMTPASSMVTRAKRPRLNARMIIARWG